MTRIAALLLALAAFFGAACSESDVGDEEADAEETTDTGSETTTGDDTSGDDEGGDDGDDEVRDGIVDSLAQQGFSEGASECVVDSVLDEGFTLEDIEDGMLVPGQDLQDAFGRAGANCLEASDLDQVADQLDLSDPIVRDQFVKNFSATSGLSIEVSECVADRLVADDVDPDVLLEAGPESQQIIQDAVAGCQGG